MDATQESIAHRRGFSARCFSNWQAVQARGSADAVAAAIRAVGFPVRSVKSVPAAERREAPYADVFQLVRLHGHDWTHVLGTADLSVDLAERLSAELNDRSLWVTYAKASNFYGYRFFEAGEQLERFSTTGDGFAYDTGSSEDVGSWDGSADLDEDASDKEILDLVFESKLRDPASLDVRRYSEPADVVDEFLRSQDLFVPNLGVCRVVPDEDKRDRGALRDRRVLHTSAWPPDVLSDGAVAESLRLVLEPRGLQKRWQRPSDADRRLHRAIVEKDVGALTKALESGADPNRLAPWQTKTPLAQAGTRGDLRGELLRALLAAGADPDDGGDVIPLHEAMSAVFVSDALATAHALLQAGADVNRADDEGKTALHRARKPSLVKLLLLSGADVTRRDNVGRTARDSLQSLLDTFDIDDLQEVAELLDAAAAGTLEIPQSAEQLIAVNRRGDAPIKVHYAEADRRVGEHLDRVRKKS